MTTPAPGPDAAAGGDSRAVGGPRGLVLAAPASNSGKTTVTLALLRALRRRGLAVAGAKVGPDYIDPAFHTAASGRPCLSLDTWAMPWPLVQALVRAHGRAGVDLVVVEGAMGLFDGAFGVTDAAADGSTASVAAALGWPVVLIVDAKGMGASAGALVRGFAQHRPDVRLAGVILNRVGSPRHAAQLVQAIAAACPDLALLGSLPRTPALGLPERHLGLVQAGEHPDLDPFLDQAAERIAEALDLAGLVALARPLAPTAARPTPRMAEQTAGPPAPLPPPGQRIAVARDVAFAFAYPQVLAGWRGMGAEILPFSPLADQAPAADADAVFLPGGYPELHAGALAAAGRFLAGLRAAAARKAQVFGECGGYMVLGDRLIDAHGTAHAMAGLLPVATSFADRRLHLGYRRLTLTSDHWLGAAGTRLFGHEFHYARIITEDTSPAARLFQAQTAAGDDRGAIGHQHGSVSGSFAHLIARGIDPSLPA